MTKPFIIDCADGLRELLERRRTLTERDARMLSQGWLLGYTRAMIHATSEDDIPDAATWLAAQVFGSKDDQPGETNDADDRP